MQKHNYKNPTYINGFKTGVPIALGYFVVSFTFGMTGALMGLNPFNVIFMSMTNLTSAGQFAGASLIVGSAGYFELVLTVAIINIRYLLMSTAISQKLPKQLSFWKRSVMAFGVTDETFTLAMVDVKTITFEYFMGLVTLPYLGWSLGTACGALSDNLMSDAMQSAASLALYCMFIALVVPPSKHQKDIRFVCIIAAIVRVVLTFTPEINSISVGYSIIIAAVLAAAIGACCYPEHPKNQVEEA